MVSSSIAVKKALIYVHVLPPLTVSIYGVAVGGTKRIRNVARVKGLLQHLSCVRALGGSVSFLVRK